MKIKRTPYAARIYLVTAALLLVLPSLMTLYSGQTGKFLIASAKAHRDPYFNETVLFIAQHNGYSATGLIINKPFPRGEALKRISNLPENQTLYYGGPVENYSLYVIERSRRNKDGADNVNMHFYTLPNYKRENPEEWLAFMNGKPNPDLRIYAGYAGWGALQLERELFRGGWATLPSDSTLIFDTPAENVWAESTQRISSNRKVISEDRI